MSETDRIAESDPHAKTEAPPTAPDPPDGGAGSAEGVVTHRDREAARAKLFGQPRVATRVGRHVVIELLGQGGMGVVLAAYDPKLDRKLAIKLLHAGGGTDRLMREAKAMARVSHRNVVGVFDVGTHDDDVFIAMEFIDGRPLSRWLDEENRSVAAVLEVFVAAGRGLAAAHAVGLIHRDFKPDNVMVTDDGDVKVLDFGLARGGLSDVPTEVVAPTRDDVDGPAVDTSLTRTGTVLGTPAYMAPEQHLAGEVDERTDQFSYCVALWEALYGRRPFAGKSLVVLADNVTQGRVEPPPSDTAVPGWVREAVQRGLSADPDARWPTMADLLAQLEDDPVARLRRRASRVLGLAAVGGLAATAYVMGGEEAPCAQVAARAQEIWSDARRDAVHEHLQGQGAFGASVATRVDAEAQDFVGRFVEARTDWCEAALVEHAVSHLLMDLGAACFDRRLDELDAVLTELARGDAAVSARGVDAIRTLGSLEACRDRERLLQRVPPPEDEATAAAVENARRGLAGVQAAVELGLYAQATQSAAALARDAEALGFEPLQAEVAFVAGMALGRDTKVEPARERLRDAWRHALRSGDEAIAVDAATELVFVVGRQASDLDAAIRWEQDARALGHRVQGRFVDPGRLDSALGSALLGAGKADEALAHAEKGLALRRAALGDDAPAVAESLLNIGGVYEYQGDYERSLATFAEARAQLEAIHGPEHPLVAVAISNHANSRMNRGDYAGAGEAFEQARAMLLATVGEDHAQMGAVCNGLAMALWSAGDLEGAEQALRDAVRIKTQAHGRQHPHVAIALANLGDVLEEQGRLQDALAAHIEALQLRLALRGEDHVDVALSRLSLAELAEAMGDLVDAEAGYRTSLQTIEASVGPDHRYVAFALHGLGRVLTAQGRHAEAAPLLRRCVQIRAAILDPGATDLEDARASLAAAEAAP